MLSADDEMNLGGFLKDNGDGFEVQRAALAGWFVPRRIHIENDELIYDGLDGQQIKPARTAIFPQFITLWRDSDKAILRFAERYGVLELCEHDKPVTHTPAHCPTIGGNMRHITEPLSVWRKLSKEAHSLLMIANRLIAGKPGQSEHWLAVYSDRSDMQKLWTDARRSRPSLAYEKALLVSDLNKWVEDADMRPRLVWRSSDRRPTLQPFRGYGLFGYLVTQLITVAGNMREATCAHCGKNYIPPNRRPKSGQRSFCPECGQEGIPRRYSLMDFRERQRKGDNK